MNHHVLPGDRQPQSGPSELFSSSAIQASWTILIASTLIFTVTAAATDLSQRGSTEAIFLGTSAVVVFDLIVFTLTPLGRAALSVGRLVKRRSTTPDGWTRRRIVYVIGTALTLALDYLFLRDHPYQRGAVAPSSTTAGTSASAATPAASAPSVVVTVSPSPAHGVVQPQSSGVRTLASTLRQNMSAFPASIDPARAISREEVEVVRRVFSNLYSFDDKANLVPDQADGMPISSADGKTITVRLKKGLVWSDGKPLTAKDWVYGTKRQLNPLLASRSAFMLFAIDGAEKYHTADPVTMSGADLRKLRDAVGIIASDDTTIVYRLTDPAPWFRLVLATWNGLPVREDLITTGGASEENEAWTVPGKYVGNGAYILIDEVPQIQFNLQANPKYVQGEAPIKNVQYSVITSGTDALAAYKAGTLDIVGVNLSNIDLVNADSALRQELVMVPTGCTSYIGFNTTREPFSNVKVRQAFSMALNRMTFAGQIEKGLALPADQFLPPGFPGHYDISPQTFDPSSAKQALADAGFGYGRGLPPISLTFPNTNIDKEIAQAAQAMFLKNLEVSVQLTPVEVGTFTEMVKRVESTPQMFPFGWCQYLPDPHASYSAVFQAGSVDNQTGWKDDQFDRLTKQADIEVDAARRDDLYRQAARAVNSGIPVAFLFYVVTAWLVKPRVQGYKPNPFDYFFGQGSLFKLKLNG